MENKTNLITGYLMEVKTELKKVVWPTKKDTINHSLLVIGISVAVAVFISILDYVFSLGIERII